MITLHVQASSKVLTLLEGWHDHIKEKVGAKIVHMGTKEVPVLSSKTEEKIKDEQICIALEKV